jgi:hypothetical protein
MPYLHAWACHRNSKWRHSPATAPATPTILNRPAERGGNPVFHDDFLWHERVVQTVEAIPDAGVIRAVCVIYY